MLRTCSLPVLRQHLLGQSSERGEFRWRGHSHVSRIESFSDTVFAVALTITIVSAVEPRSFDELALVLAGFVGFAIVFSFLMQLWYFHFLFFRRYNLQDATTLYLNAVLLFVILFFTFPLKFLFTALVGVYVGWLPHFPHLQATLSGRQWPLLMAVYGSGVFLLYALYAVMYGHAYRLRSALELDARESWLTRYSVIIFASVALVGLLSIAVTFATGSPILGGLTYVLATLPQEIGNRIKRRKLKALADAAAPSIG